MKQQALALALSGMMAASGIATAQSFPSKPIRISTVEAGGGLDITLRTFSPVLGSRLGQSIVIENRPVSANPELAVVRSQADGHSLLYWANPMWLGPFMRTDVSYDPVRDFAPISLTARTPSTLVVTNSLPVSTVREFIAYAKGRPKELNYVMTSPSASPALSAVLFDALAGTQMVGVAYKGGAQGIADLLAGRVQVMFPSLPLALPLMKGNKLKALGITTTETSPLAPDLAPIASLGLPGYESVSLQGLFAKAGTSPAIINRLNQEVIYSINRPEVKEKLVATGLDIVGSTPEQLGNAMKSEMAKMGKLIRDMGIKAD